MEVLAILGRGVQMLDPNSDPTDVRSYDPTEDIEVCDERFAHLAVRVPADDGHPNAIIGGGQLNTLAGAKLIREHSPRIVVCAHAHRSPYLERINGPTESEVMTHILSDIVPGASKKIVAWPREYKVAGPSNTVREVQNIFDLALQRDAKNIGFVTVGVHMPRTAMFIAQLQSRDLRYRTRSAVLLTSEEVLLQSGDSYRSRIQAMWGSKTFARNWAKEANGAQHAIRGTY